MAGEVYYDSGHTILEWTTEFYIPLTDKVKWFIPVDMVDIDIDGAEYRISIVHRPRWKRFARYHLYIRKKDQEPWDKYSTWYTLWDWFFSTKRWLIDQYRALNRRVPKSLLEVIWDMINFQYNPVLERNGLYIAREFYFV